MKKIVSILVITLAFGMSNMWATTCNIDWGQLGPDSTQLKPVESWISDCGTTGMVETSGRYLFGLMRVDQPVSWLGNFNDGDKLLFLQDWGASFRIVFSSPVTGGGANIQWISYGPFWASVAAYDINGNLIAGSNKTLLGNSSNARDGSAIFLDTSGLSNVYTLDFQVTAYSNSAPDAFAINSPRIYAPDVTATPEPVSLLLLSTGLLSAVGYGRRRLVSTKD